LVRDYLDGAEGAARFFPWTGWSDDPDQFREKARLVGSRFDRAARERVAAMVRAPGVGAAARLESWVERGGYLVTTGQQPGLFTGPLYSVYKALTAACWAEALEDVVGVPVLPLFWVASEDHDWEEAHDTWIVGMDNELHHVELPPPPPEERNQPLHRCRAHLEEALGRFLEHLPDSDFSKEYIKLLRDTWEGGVSLPDAFRTTLEGLLAPFGVLFVDAHAPLLKEASRGVLVRELEGAAAHEEVLSRRAAELDGAGYGVQVSVLEGGVNLFMEGPGGRERLYRDGVEDGAGFTLKGSGYALTREEVLAGIAATPCTVSPNVLLRPVVESAVFPTLAYVGGPGEMAYFGQLEPLFQAHGVDMPVVLPRFSVTVLESKIRKVLDKFGLPPHALARPFHEVAADIARDELPDEVREALRQLKGAIGQGTAALSEAAKAIDPTLKGPISHARGVAFGAVQEAEKKILQAVKRENEIALQQLDKARLHLYPDGRPQERVLNVFYYLTRYGDRFLHDVSRRFAAALPPSLGRG
jgi:bacillithiol biosynthesis cysteine-adding enzyme BshC